MKWAFPPRSAAPRQQPTQRATTNSPHGRCARRCAQRSLPVFRLPLSVPTAVRAARATIFQQKKLRGRQPGILFSRTIFLLAPWTRSCAQERPPTSEGKIRSGAGDPSTSSAKPGLARSPQPATLPPKRPVYRATFRADAHAVALPHPDIPPANVLPLPDCSSQRHWGQTWEAANWSYAQSRHRHLSRATCST